jgi:hypothetical protein
MTAGDWIAIILHAISEGVSAAITASRDKRVQLAGQAPDLGWKARQAAAAAAPSSAPAKAGPS